MSEEAKKPELTESQQIDQQINALIDKDDAPPSASVTTVAPASQEDKPAADQDKPTGEAIPEAIPADDKNLLAGIYKTPDDLKTGVLELADKLGIPRFQLRHDLKGDVKDIEELYKEMQGDFTKRQMAEKAKEAASAKEPEVELKPLTDEERTKIGRVELVKQLRAHEVYAKLNAKGLDIPRTQEELDALEEESPALWFQLKQAIGEITQNIEATLNDYNATITNRQATIGTVKEDGVKALKALSEELHLGLTPDEMAEIANKAIANAELTEEKYGIKIPRKDAVERYFLQFELKGRVKSAMQNAINKAKIEQSKDLDRMRDAALSTASTSKLSTSVDRTKAGTVDLTNHNQVMGLGEKEINKKILEQIEKED